MMVKAPGEGGVNRKVTQEVPGGRKGSLDCYRRPPGLMAEAPECHRRNRL